MISRREDAAIVCHRCGRKASSFRVGATTIAEDVHQIRIVGGHGDEFPQDLDVLEFDVCGSCLRAWVEEFVYTQKEEE